MRQPVGKEPSLTLGPLGREAKRSPQVLRHAPACGGACNLAWTGRDQGRDFFGKRPLAALPELSMVVRPSRPRCVEPQHGQGLDVGPSARHATPKVKKGRACEATAEGTERMESA